LTTSPPPPSVCVRTHVCTLTRGTWWGVFLACCWWRLWSIERRATLNLTFKEMQICYSNLTEKDWTRNQDLHLETAQSQVRPCWDGPVGGNKTEAGAGLLVPSLGYLWMEGDGETTEEWDPSLAEDFGDNAACTGARLDGPVKLGVDAEINKKIPGDNICEMILGYSLYLEK